MVAAATALVLIVVGSAVYVGTHAAQSSAAQAQNLTAARAKIEAELLILTAFVARDRGLPWKTQPKAEVLADADFVRALESTGNSSGDTYDYKADPDDTATTFAALGLVANPDAFDQAQNAADASNVIGFYDDQTTRLVVRGSRWTPSMEYTLVHELTHALQDQTFDLGKLRGAARYDDESALALQSVIEGDAERVADDYYDIQSTSWQDSVDSDQGQAPPSDVPVIDTLDAIPYEVGEPFVTEVFKAGGNADVDRAFTAPPTTSAQLLNARSWLAGLLPAPKRLPWPVLGHGKLADRGELGVIGFWLTIDGDNPHLADAAALDGWAGDAYVTTSDAGSSCFVDDARFTDAGARDKAVAFLEPWFKADAIQAGLVGATDLHLTACH